MHFDQDYSLHQSIKLLAHLLLGADELKVLWTDEDYSPDQNAFYYARVIQNPTCRWTTYDSLRTGQKISKAYSATMAEMAWSSPIWIK